LTQRSRSIADCVLLGAFCGAFFFAGLGYFGLVGADEPRYAQVAREMLARHDSITPTLGGRPWLEKPVLYYWQAMLAYRVFGVSDWAARLGSAVDATLMIMGVYVFLRRLFPRAPYAGFHRDGALFTASAAGVVGFARAASTDMPLAAMFTLCLLAWYLWRQNGKRLDLACFYLFLGLATLAKGPVAPFLAGAVIVIFAISMRDLRILRGTLWLPGILLFAVVTLPWYLAVELRNPEFVRVFIVEHNLARFGTDIYRHSEPFWYYLPVAWFGLMPWIIFIVGALVGIARRWRPQGEQGAAAGGPFSIFLAIWFVVPLLFFSISRSKLPGYILPALPAGTLLLADYVGRKIANGVQIRLRVIVLHAIVAASLVIPALMIQSVLLQHRWIWNRKMLGSCSVAVVLAVAMAVLVSTSGLKRLAIATLLPVGIALVLVLRLGSPVLDQTLSVRPWANDLRRIENSFPIKPLPVAILRLSREDEYGLQFYFDSPIPRYELGEIPAREHIVVVPRELAARVMTRAEGRKVVHVGGFAPRALEYFWVSASASALNLSNPGPAFPARSGPAPAAE
jgi:4-amino-4-deoxy-L-arabinose transferase-like glycosyltransferase